MPAFFRFVLPVLLLSVPPTGSAQPYRNLALEGGGIRGIAYAGAIQELESRHMLDSIRHIAGTSVGSVAGALLAVGYTAGEIRELLFSLNIRTFNDGQWSLIGGQRRLRKEYGWYRGEALERWVGRQIAAKTGSPDLTFEALHRLAQTNRRFRDLYITATNLSAQAPVVFSWRTHPQMAVKTAVRTSISIPLYFRGVWLDSSGQKPVKGSSQRYDLYVDGGIRLNYPLNVFDSAGTPNRATLGLKLERPEQLAYFRDSEGIAPYRIRSFPGYVAALYNVIIEGLNRNMPVPDEAFRTIYISTENMNPRVRRITRQQKELLFQSGLRGARQFLGALPKT